MKFIFSLYRTNNLLLLVQIVPLGPAPLTNGLPALVAAHSRPFAWAASRTFLLHGERRVRIPVAHPTILAPNTQRHTNIGAAVRPHALATFVVAYGTPLRPGVGDSAGETFHAKTIFAITRVERVTSDIVWAIFWVTIPIERQAVVHEINGKINLKLPPALIFAHISHPVRIADTVCGTIDDDVI